MYVAWTNQQNAKLCTLARDLATTARSIRAQLIYATAALNQLKSSKGVQVETRSEDDYLNRRFSGSLLDSVNPVSERNGELSQQPVAKSSVEILCQASVRLAIMSARVAINNERYGEAWDILSEVLVEANATGRSPLIARCHYWKGVAEDGLATYEAALRSFEQAQRCQCHFRERKRLDERIQDVNLKLEERGDVGSAM